MKRKTYLKILCWPAALVLLIILVTTVFAGPPVRRKILRALNENSKDYIVEIDKVHISVITPGIELKGLKISSKTGHGIVLNLYGEISSIKFKGIKLAKAIFKKDIDIRDVIISNSIIKGKVPFSRKAKPTFVLPLNIRIGRILFDGINLSIGSTSTAQAYFVQEGILNLYNLRVSKQDTLSPGIVKQFDFEAEKLISVSSDSLYSLTTIGIIYSATSNSLSLKSFSIQPNYKEYEFTARNEFQTDCIEAGFSNIKVLDFNASHYLRSGSLISSYIEIGKLNMKVFRDKRKEFRHVKKPAFQDMIYNYPGIIRIDSIGLINGNITYNEHAEKANEHGSISFNEINAKIYKITNDPQYKTEKAYLELKSDALLMGKGKMAIFLKVRIFDSQNTFSLNGTLSGMEANELNPMLQKNAFFYVTSGKIDAMNYSFTANNIKANGKMTMLYHGLNISVKNKRTDDTTAFSEKFISLIVNKKLLDSNPVPGEDVREGIIDYQRDPERFLFGYCFKSILSGIKSSLVKSPKKRKK
jgi:hypothetical protein